MLAAIFMPLFLLAQLMDPRLEILTVATSQPTTQQVVVVVATSQPAVNSADRTIMDAFSNTTLAKLASGRRKLNVQDIMQLEFWLGTIQELVVAAFSFIPRILVALIFLLVFWVLYRALRRVVVGSMSHANVDQSIRDMLGHLVKWAVMGFGLVIAFNQIGIQITALLTGVSIIGLAIGFAAQETLANFIAGVVIFWDKPFKIGDWVEIEGTFGQVQRVTFRSTRILDLDGHVCILPNTHMLSNKLSNHTTNPLTRVNVEIGIAYKENVADARKALLALVTDDARLSPQPAASVVVIQCADSSVNLRLLFWIYDESQERLLRCEYLEKAKQALQDAGISIPFPHLQVIMEK